MLYVGRLIEFRRSFGAKKQHTNQVKAPSWPIFDPWIFDIKDDAPQGL